MVLKGLFGCVSTRLFLTFLTATGMMELFMSRTNLSIAIVAMVRIATEESLNTTEARGPYCTSETSTYQIGNNASRSSQSFVYRHVNESDGDGLIDEQKSNYAMTITSFQRGNLLSALFYAFPLTSIIGGRLSEIYGTKKVFGLAILIEAFGNFLTPVAAKTNYWLVFIIRVAMGMAQGCAYPATNVLAAKWIPPSELSRFTGFVLTASSLGTVFALTVYGFIISAFGWEYVFYICGSISLSWVLVWTFCMFNSPEEHPRISKEERVYILNSLAKSKLASANKPKSVPWFKMLTSVPLWAVSIAHAGSLFGLNFSITQLPIYMNSIVGVNIRNNGLLSSSPFLARFIFTNIFGWILPLAMKTVDWSSKTWKRFITIFGFIGPAFALLAVGYVGCNMEAVVSLFVVGIALNGATLSGHSCNFFEISPNFVGTITGVAGTIAYLYGMIGPIIFGALTPEETLEEWKVIYWIIFFNYAIAGSFYCVFLSTDVQPWNDQHESKDKEQHIVTNMEKEDKDDILTDIESVTKF